MASRQSRVAELANTVAQHTQLVDNYLAEKGLPYQSFKVDEPFNLRLPPEVEESREIVLQASQELNGLLQGPRDLLFNHQVCIHLNPPFNEQSANAQNSITGWCISS